MQAQRSCKLYQGEEVHEVGVAMVEYSGVVEQPRTVMLH